jgi:magnesium transporter
MEALIVETTLPAYGQITFETAAEHACTQVPVVAPTACVGEIRRTLMGQHYESATHIVVCEDGTFRGILRIEDLLEASEEVTASDIMDPEAPCVAPGVDQEVAAWHAVHHAESALAVVNVEGGFLGLIPPHRLLEVLLSEHEEDLSRLGGFLKNSSTALHSSQEVVSRRFWHRLPWLLLGLLGALLAADIVGWFETQLQGHVALAFFIPGIVYLADAVGTQTETVVVRGLSVGVGIRQIIGREILTGVLIGVVLSLVSLPLLYWRWGDGKMALGVALSLCAACSTATVAAMALPWVFDCCNIDPAFGSGPLATVIQDLLSIVMYFVIATAIV